MADEEYQSIYTGEQIDAGIGKANTSVQPETLSQGLATKQNILISGANIKTINNESILGSGNIDIQGGGSCNFNVRVIDASDPTQWEDDELTEAVIQDIIENDYQALHLDNLDIEGMNIDGWMFALNAVDFQDTTAKYFYHFDEGDEDEGTTPNIETWLFVKQPNGQGGYSYDMVSEQYPLGSEVSGTDDGSNWTTLTINGITKNIPAGGSGMNIYSFHESDLGQTVLSYIVNNNPDMLRVTSQQSNVQDYYKGQDKEYYCLIEGSFITLKITGSEGNYTPEISSYNFDNFSTVSGTDDGTNWTSLTINGTTRDIPSGGGGTSTDVQINGTSIVSGGVADIETKGTYDATTNKIATMNDVPENPLAGKKVSLIGDSITTWSTVKPDSSYQSRYPAGVIQNINQTWWWQTINNGGMTLLRNTAYNGSSCTGRDGGSGHSTSSTTDPYAACSNKRIADLSDGTSNPDIVICLIGINDFGSDKNTPTGNYVGLEAVPADSSNGMATFSEGYALMLKKIATSYPSARIYCCTLPSVGQGSVSNTYTQRWFGNSFPVYNTTTHAFLADYNNTIRTLAKNMGACVIEFAECINIWNAPTFLEDGLHPNIAGMELLGNKALATIQNDFATKERV